MNNGHNVMKTVLISNLISSVKQRNGLRKVIHIIHNFKKFFGGILSLSPCCLHFVHIVFLFVHTYILELITLFDQFSPQNIEFHPPIHKVIHIIHKSIHIIHQGFIQELSPILSTFSPDSKLYFFWRVCYSILRIIQNTLMLFSGI